MTEAFYLAAFVAVLSTGMVITRMNAVHALLYLVVSLLSVALIFFLVGAPFAAALEVILYAGAIMVLFVFVIMMLNLGPQTAATEREWLQPRVWAGPALLAFVLMAEILYLLTRAPEPVMGLHTVSPKQVGVTLFGPYLLGVELASFLLLAGLVGAFHIGRRDPQRKQTGDET
jgi:NADH-quinone oxidoreductase subunit J